MNCTYDFLWINFLQNDLTGWIQSNKRFDFSTTQTAHEVVYWLKKYYFMVCFLFSSRIVSQWWQTVTHLFFFFWWTVVVNIRLPGSAYGQRQVASHADARGPGNWSLCHSDICDACGSLSTVVLCVDHMSMVGHVSTLLPFWFPKTQHCWNRLRLEITGDVVSWLLFHMESVW